MSYVALSSVQVENSSQITSGRARLYNMYVTTTSTAGYIRLHDGGSLGNVIFELALPDTGAVPWTTSYLPVELPRYGIPFTTDLYMEVSNAESVTLVYDGLTVPSLRLASGGFLHLTDGTLLELAA